MTGVDDCVDKQYDDTAQADIRARVASVIASKPRDEWVAILAGADTCVSPVLSPSEAATTAPTSTTGDIRQLTPLLAGQVRRASYVGPADE